MKTFLIAAVAALTATPAVAGTNDFFTGPRIGATMSITDPTISGADAAFGADVGVDVPLGDRFTIGAEAFAENVFEDERTIGAAARLGYAVEENILVYGRAGYSNYEDVFSRELDGLTVGGGLEFSAPGNMYIKTEYRYSDFDQNVGSHAGLVGVGFRF